MTISDWPALTFKDWVQSGDCAEDGERLCYRVSYKMQRPPLAMHEQLRKFLRSGEADDAVGLAFGDIVDSRDTLRAFGELFDEKNSLPNLRYLKTVCNDKVWFHHHSEDFDIDIDSLLTRFPGLEVLHFSSAGAVTNWNPVRHICLRELDATILNMNRHDSDSVAASIIPELETLNIKHVNYWGEWSRSEAYWPYITDCPFPKLKNLGIVGCKDDDALVSALLASPVLNQLETLNLSSCDMDGDSAKRLFDSAAVRELKYLDLSSNQIDSESIKEIEESGLRVNFDSQEYRTENSDLLFE